MYCDEWELTRLAIYSTIDLYMKKYKLIEHCKKTFKLSNGYKYKVKPDSWCATHVADKFVR